MKLTQWMIEQAAAHTRRQLDDLRFDLAQAKGRLEAATDEIVALRQRVAEMAPQKQFAVKEYSGKQLDILSVAHLGGKTVITVGEPLLG